MIDRMIPTRSAAIALLTVDAILLPLPFAVDWHSWFAIAYAPLLFTVVWGFLMGEIWKIPLILAALAISLLPVVIGIVLLMPFHDLSWLTYALIGNQILVATVLVVFAVLSIRGWVNYFRYSLYERQIATVE